MSDWDDRDLEPHERSELTPEAYTDLGHGSGTKWPLLAGGLALLAASALALFWHFSGVSDVPETIRSDARGPATEAPPPATAAGETSAEEPPFDLPALDESDALVRELLGALSSHAGLAAYFVTEDLARTGVAMVVNVAEGGAPARHVRHLGPEGRFDVLRRGARLYVDPESYRRYDALAEGIASLDADGVAELYRRIEPLTEQAYRELGYRDDSFDHALARAMRVLLETPVPRGPLEVEAVSVNYAFVDRKLESLSPAQKQLLRMGPVNARKIQSKLEEIAEALALPPSPG